MVHSPAGYRRFGDAVRSHWGTDIALEYYVNDKFTVWANGSYLSQNYWAVGDDDLPFEAYLNTPKVKYRGGIMYGGTGKGMFGSLILKECCSTELEALLSEMLFRMQSKG